MNPIVHRHFDALEARLLESPAVLSYRISSREIAFSDGKLRARATLSGGGTAEFFEYIFESEGRICLLKYSFHWQDARGRLIRRWDNAPHFPDLCNAPHHIHETDDTVSSAQGVPDIFSVIEEIEQALAQV